MLASVARDARLSRDYLLLCILSVGLATIGLLQSSTAVVIGAMLISPLMKPIMGLGFAIAIFDNLLLRRALVTLGVGVGLSITCAILLILLSPVKDVTPEILGRTQPSLLDLVVAVFGGCAGGYAVINKQFGTMIGVGIATALMPPLATVAFGLATVRPGFAVGASLLFLTNVMAIAFSVTVIVRLYGFGPFLTPRQTRFQTAAMLIALGLISIPLGLSLQDVIADARLNSRARAAVSAVMGQRAEISQLEVERVSGRVKLAATVIAQDYDPGRPARITSQLEKELGSPVDVQLMQVREQSGQFEALEARLTSRLVALENEMEAQAINNALRDAGFGARQVTLDHSGRVAIIQIAGDDKASLDALAAVASHYPLWRFEPAFPPEMDAPISDGRSVAPGSPAPPH